MVQVSTAGSTTAYDILGDGMLKNKLCGDCCKGLSICVNDNEMENISQIHYISVFTTKSNDLLKNNDHVYQ